MDIKVLLMDKILNCLKNDLQSSSENLLSYPVSLEKEGKLLCAEMWGLSNEIRLV